MGKLEKRLAPVTGEASGLGKAIVLRLATEGAPVVITDVDQARGEATATEGGLTFLSQDVTDETCWTRVLEDIQRRQGRLDILVNNAGIIGPAEGVSPESTALADWRRIFAVNVEGVFLGCRAGIAALRRSGGGSIINVSSVAALLATPFATAYGASRAAVRQLTKSVAQHCVEQRLSIRCNSVHPEDVRTSLSDRFADEAARRRGVPLDQHVSEERAANPLGDFTRAEDVASAVAFLASDDALHITGTALVVDGGLVACETFRGAMT